MRTGTIESRSPQDPSDVVVSAPAADREDVAAAFKRARAAQREWGRNAVARADALSSAAAALDAAKDEAVDLMIREVGKPRAESVMEHGRAVRILRYQAQAALEPDGDTLPAAPPAPCAPRRRPRGPPRGPRGPPRPPPTCARCCSRAGARAGSRASSRR